MCDDLDGDLLSTMKSVRLTVNYCNCYVGGSPDSCIQLLYCTDGDPTDTKLTLGCTTEGPYFLGFTLNGLVQTPDLHRLI